MTKYLLTYCVLMTAVGCGNPFGGTNSKVESGHSPGVDVSVPASSSGPAPAAGSEFVSSSQKLVATQHGRFKVNATLSSPTHEVLLTTSTRGYKVLSNIQGEFLPEGVVE
ncbi:MAG: hypothetical protein AAGB31_11910 [Bdellovibrio sp.]